MADYSVSTPELRGAFQPRMGIFTNLEYDISGQLWFHSQVRKTEVEPCLIIYTNNGHVLRDGRNI
jgi:hypothetical protein